MTNERPRTDHVISGPMRGLEKTAPYGGGVHIGALYIVQYTLHLQLYLLVHCTLYTAPAAVPVPVPVLRYMYLTSGTCSTSVAAGTWTIMCIH